jgi:peroxiredoxin
MTNQIKAFLFATLLLATACGRGDRASLQGTFGGVPETPVYLEQVSVGQSGPMDTAVTDDKGRFRFTVSLTDGQPAFYNLRCNDQTIVLLLAPGEQVEVRSLGNLAQNYEIEGSEGSGQIRTLNRMMTANRRSLDSLAGIYQRLDPQDTALRSTLQQYSKLYIRQKQEMIALIVNHATSLSAIYALYQRMPNGEWYFSDEQDVVYFRMVADSLGGRYPLSPHVVSLKKDVGRMQNQTELIRMLNQAPVSPLNYPDIELPDVFGSEVKLSSLQGGVILLDFWISTSTEARLRNAELAEVYAACHDRGFEIYQVSLDQSKLAWVTAIQEQKLPWVSVCDFLGVDSPAARTYNVTRLPANVLIDRQGEIVVRDVPVEQLEARIRELL